MSRYIRLSRRTVSSALLSLVLVFIGPLVMTVGAQDATSQGVQISPAKVELNATRGKTYTINLRVMNVTGGDLAYSTAVADFTSSGETGTPSIVENSTLPETASIKTWVSIESGFTLGAHQQKNVDATVTVPDNAEAGGHYGVVSFSGSTPNMDATGVGISASAGVLFLIKVDGSIVEKASLASFYTANTDGKQSSFFENSPITFVTRIDNVGNVHVKPTGSVEVTDMFGNSVIKESINSDLANILPKSIRRFDTKIDKPWMIGLYTANLTLGYGTTGQAITNTITFWVIPYKLILGVVLILATLIYILKLMVTRYNKKIERRVLQQHENKKHNNKGKS